MGCGCGFRRGKAPSQLEGRRMDRADISFWLSIFGSATSTILAVIKGVEFYSARRVSISVDGRFTGHEGIGNQLVLLNRSSTPITISYYELAWVERRRIAGVAIPFTRNVTFSETPLDPMDGCAIPLPPHTPHSLDFRDEYHFNWGGNLEQAIYLKLWRVGSRSPIWLWVTGPGSKRPK
jgi:hypothetical protein